MSESKEQHEEKRNNPFKPKHVMLTYKVERNSVCLSGWEDVETQNPLFKSNYYSGL